MGNETFYGDGLMWIWLKADSFCFFSFASFEVVKVIHEKLLDMSGQN